MRGSPLTKAHVATELGRLLRVFKRPAHAPSDLATYAADFGEICNDVSAEQFTQAVTTYLKGDHQFMPKPGQLRTLAREQPGVGGYAGASGEDYESWVHRGGTDRDGQLSPCPACGHAWAWYPRLHCVHDHARHRALKIACLGRCDDPGCVGPPAISDSPIVRQSEGQVWVPAPPVETAA